jgi:3-dehydroquinate synthase
MLHTISFPTGKVDYYLNSSCSQLFQIAPTAHNIIITDKNINQFYGDLFSIYRVIIIKPGEDSKNWETINSLASKLAALEVHKTTTIIGIGGGVISDIVGFLASVYMRGVSFAFVPTSLLGMVDAAIGGKNGINVDVHKNMIGTIRQPKFILYDTSFLKTLPDEEWSNGFAEIIKYGCIGEPKILADLETNNINTFRSKPEKMNELIAICIQQKNNIVVSDEQESGVRKVLNFGHTTGHAFETLYKLPHGQAVSLGMLVALIASEKHTNLSTTVRMQIIQTLQHYGLPVKLRFDIDKVVQTLRLDKKRNNDAIDFVLLEALGKPIVKSLTFTEIREALQIFADAIKH